MPSDFAQSRTRRTGRRLRRTTAIVLIGALTSIDGSPIVLSLTTTVGHQTHLLLSIRVQQSGAVPTAWRERR